MDALDLLLKRRSVPARNMVEPGPDAAALERILRAGTRVPDHGKLAPWRIQLLRKDGQRRLGEAMAEIFARETPTPPRRWSRRRGRSRLWRRCCW